MNDNQFSLHPDPGARQTRSRSISILDVAREAGVSAATVSRVLNGSPVPTDETRKRVLGAARCLEYHPNIAARDLRLGARGRGARAVGAIGLLYYGLDDSVWTGNDFYNRVFVGVERAADARRQHLLMSRISQEGLPPRMVEEMRVDGVVTVGHVTGEMAAAIAEQVPVVLFNYFREGAGADSVMCDNRQGIRAAVTHLTGLGHRRIAFLGRNEEPHLHIEERLDAFRQAAREFGVEEHEGYSRFTTGRNVRENAERNAQVFVDLGGRRPTALICAGDVPARAFVSAARQRGIRVPEDVSIVGFDDTISATSEEPHLTTLHQPLEEMAQMAVDMLVRRVAEPGGIRKRTLVETQLIVRASSAPVQGGKEADT